MGRKPQTEKSANLMVVPISRSEALQEQVLFSCMTLTLLYRLPRACKSMVISQEVILANQELLEYIT